MGGGDGGGINSMLSSSQQLSLEGLQHHQNGHSHSQQHYDEETPQNDDFLEQMLSTIPNCSWPPPPPDLSNPNLKSGDSVNPDAPPFHYPFDDSKLRHLQINGTAKSLLLQQQLLLSRGGGDAAAALRSPSASAGDSPLLPFPLSLGSGDRSQHDVVDPSPFKSPGAAQGLQGAAEASVQALYNGFGGSLNGNGQPPTQPHFQAAQVGGAMGGQNYGAQAGTGAVMNQGPASTATGGSSGAGAAPQRQRVRARRGQATDPHSIAERLRRERIAERMKALQELVPNANKTDKASMLDEIIDYVKFLQLQVKVLSMSRLGGAAAVAPLVADMSNEGGRGGVGRSSNGNKTNDSMTVTEQQVAKLMEEDMGSAMQYLQGKGLCLMPISLATAISTATATCHGRSPLPLPLPPTRTTQPTVQAQAQAQQRPSSPNLSIPLALAPVDSGPAMDTTSTSTSTSTS